MIRIADSAHTHIAIAEGPGDSTPPGKTGVPSSTGAPPSPVATDIPVDEKGPDAQSAPLPKSQAPTSEGLSVPENQRADQNPGLSELEFAELKLIFNSLQQTSKTRGAEAKAIYKRAAQAIWQKMVAPKVSASQREDFNKLSRIG